MSKASSLCVLSLLQMVTAVSLDLSDALHIRWTSIRQEVDPNVNSVGAPNVTQVLSELTAWAAHCFE